MCRCAAVTAHLVGIHSAIKMLNARVKLIEQFLHKMQMGALQPSLLCSARGHLITKDGATYHLLLLPLLAGELPFNHALVRKISSLVHSLPAMNTAEFNKDYLMVRRLDAAAGCPRRGLG